MVGFYAGEAPFGFSHVAPGPFWDPSEIHRKTIAPPKRSWADFGAPSRSRRGPEIAPSRLNRCLDLPEIGKNMVFEQTRKIPRKSRPESMLLWWLRTTFSIGKQIVSRVFAFYEKLEKTMPEKIRKVMFFWPKLPWGRHGFDLFYLFNLIHKSQTFHRFPNMLPGRKTLTL